VIKKAFTIIELIFIIILIGIMSAVATSYLRDDKLALATYQVLEHIRYTQHLAISEHKFDPKDALYNAHTDKKGPYGRWYYSRWQIWFRTNSNHMLYAIFSDRNRGGNFDYVPMLEAAKDPLTLKVMAYRLSTEVGYQNNEEYNNENFDLTSKYGITNITTVNCNQESLNPSKARIVFDEKGRPYGGISAINDSDAYSYRIKQQCVISMIHESGRRAEITVYPETGYAEITRLD
jgi:Tfp pilus assembly protein FimT